VERKRRVVTPKPQHSQLASPAPRILSYWLVEDLIDRIACRLVGEMDDGRLPLPVTSRLVSILLEP